MERYNNLFHDADLDTWLFIFLACAQLGGVVLPNDGLCKMDRPRTPREEVDYNDWDVYDYPSIGQIAESLIKNQIIPMFAVVEKFRGLYDVRHWLMCLLRVIV